MRISGFTPLPPLENGKYTGKFDLSCPREKAVEVELYMFGTPTSHSGKFCTITFERANLLSHVLYANTENKKPGRTTSQPK